MTLETVQNAVTQLEAEGKSVSGNAVWRLTGGRRETVLALVKELRAGVGPGADFAEEDDAEGAENAAVVPVLITPDWTAAWQALTRLLTAKLRVVQATGDLAQLEHTIDQTLQQRWLARERRALGFIPPDQRRALVYNEDPAPIIALQRDFEQAHNAATTAHSRVQEARRQFQTARATVIEDVQKRWLAAQYPDLAQAIREAEALCEQVPDSQTARQVAQTRWGVLLQHRGEAPTWDTDGPHEPQP